MQPTSLDHVALWVTERDVIADFAVQQLGMHVIERTDRFTLVGWDARRGKLTLFEAEGPREPGALEHIGLRVPGGRDSVELPRRADADVRRTETATSTTLRFARRIPSERRESG